MIANGVLQEFQEFLVSHKLAKEKYVPYLAHWASQFLAYYNKKTEPANLNLAIAEYLNALESSDKIEDWQVRQAGEAVRLYINHFKGGDALTEIQEAPKLPGSLANKQQLLAEMKRLIRLKHFAYNTELSYLDWAERLFKYLRETAKSRTSDDLTPESVQNFLSHLAINKHVSSSTQNQALCAIVFLFRNVLGMELGDISGMIWAKGKKTAGGPRG